MAYRRLSLPSLRITHRPVLGDKSVHYSHQGLPHTLNKQETNHSGSMDDESRETLDHETLSMIHPDSEIMESTSHELESKASATGWAELRRHMLVAVTEIAAMPLSQVCLHFDQFAFYCCQQCGPLVFFCQECFLRSHSSVNIFHVPEKWEVTARLLFCNEIACLPS